MPAEQIQEAAAKRRSGDSRRRIDGYFLPKAPAEIFAAGEQAHVPLLVGWNSEENGARALLGAKEPTPENFAEAVRSRYTERADEVLKLYGGTTTR